MSAERSDLAPRSYYADASVPRRFIASEKWIHWSTAILFLALLVTGALLYIPSLAPLFGDRALLVRIHIYAGLLVLVPIVFAGIYSNQGSELRSRLKELSSWTGVDRRWTKRLPHLDGPTSGRFNAGQKLNGAFSLGALIAMLVTGLVMGLYIPLPIYARQGATFLHDVGFYVMAIVFFGHMAMVLSHRGSFGAMRPRLRRTSGRSATVSPKE